MAEAIKPRIDLVAVAPDSQTYLCRTQAVLEKESGGQAWNAAGRGIDGRFYKRLV